jgi:hypothetical protein
LVRFLVLAKCFGESRAAGCFRDPLLRDLMQISPCINPEMVADWLQSLSADALWTFFRELAKWHVQTGAVDGETFLLTSIEHGGSAVAILLDSVRALWLFALQQKTQKDFIQELHDFPMPSRLLFSESLWQAAKQAFPQAQLELLPGSDASTLPSLNNLVHDLTYLSLPDDFCGACAADLALSVAAQCVLRLFACKLPGFARSSLNYLYSNFLDCCAVVEETQDQRVVCVGRPPLHLVLGMAGLNRCNYRLSWLDGRPCAIFPEG